MRGKPPSILSMVDGSVITPGRDATAVAPGIDEAGIESVPGSETGTEVPGTIAAGTAWGAGGAVITAPGAEALGLGAPGCDTGIVCPRHHRRGMASGTGGAVIAAPGAEALGMGIDALGCEIGAAVPGAIATGIASGTGGDMMAAAGVAAGIVPPTTIAPKTLEAIRSITRVSIPASIPIASAPGTISLDAFTTAATAPELPSAAMPSLLVVMVVAYFHPFEHADRVFRQNRRGEIQRDQVRCCGVVVDSHESH